MPLSPVKPTAAISVDARVARATFPGFPVVTRPTLRRVAVDDRDVVRRLADGRMHVLWGVTLLIGVSPEEVTPDQVLAAAIVTVEPGAEIDGLSALERRGLWDRHDGTIHVTSERSHEQLVFDVPHAWRNSRRWRRRSPRIRVRFTKSFRPRLQAATLLDGIPTRSGIDALFRAAPDLTPLQLAKVIERAQYLREFSLEDVERCIELRRHERCQGLPNLRAAVQLRRAGSAGTKSRSEDELHPIVVRMFGEPLVNVRGAAGIPGYEPDFCWPERRWIVEVDGNHHDDDPGQRSADLARDELLRSVGWTVVRIHWSRVWGDMDGVIAELREAFGA